MSRVIGRQVAVGLGRETSRGTAVAPSYWLQWMEAYIGRRNEEVNNESSLGRTEDSDGSNIVASRGEGKIKGNMKDESIGLVLHSLLGSRADALVETGVYDHTFTLLQSTLKPTLSVAVNDPNLDRVYPNSVIDNLKIDAELGNYVMFEAGFMGRINEAANNTVTVTEERDFVPQMFTCRRAANVAGLGAASNFPIRNFSIEMKNSVLAEHVLGNLDANEIVAQQFAVEGAITLVHDDTTFEDLQNEETYQALRFDMTHSEQIGLASNPRLRITLNRCRISDYSRKLDQNGLVEESFKFKAFHSIADSAMLTVVLRNEVASY